MNQTFFKDSVDTLKCSPVLKSIESNIEVIGPGDQKESYFYFYEWKFDVGGSKFDLKHVDFVLINKNY